MGNTGGTYSRGDDTLTFVIAPGNVYAGIVFGDVAANRFDPDGQQVALAGSTAFFARTHTAGSAGLLSLSTTALPALGWATTTHHDLNCNGELDNGEPARERTAVVCQRPRCIDGRADTQRRGDGRQCVAAGLKLTKTVDKATASAGELITYTITYINQSKVALSALKIFDNTSSFTVFSSASCGPSPSAGLTCSLGNAPAAGAAGRVEWTFSGELGSAARGTVSFVVTLQ